MSSLPALVGPPTGRPPPPVRLSLFGQLTLTRGDQVLQLPYARAYAVLLVLALSMTPPNRSALVHMLWPTIPEPEARARLRHALFVLDRLLRPARVERVHQQLQLPRHALRCDVWEAIQLCERIETVDPQMLRAAHAEALTGTLRAPLAGGFTLPDAPAFEQWLAGQRDFWNRRLRQAHQRVSTELGLRGHRSESRRLSPHPPNAVFIERRWLGCVVVLAREPDGESSHRAHSVGTIGELLLKDTSAVLAQPMPGALLAVFGLLPDRSDPHALACGWAEQLSSRYREGRVPTAIGVHTGWHLTAWPEEPLDITGNLTRRALDAAARAATGKVCEHQPAGPPLRSDVEGEHTRRLNALPAILRRGASSLAVYRSSFSRSDVLVTCRPILKQLHHLCTDLTEAGILITAGRGRWRFATPLLRYFAEQRLPRPQILRLHRCVARHYRSHSQHDAAAQHFTLGHQPSQAAAAWHAAGEQHLAKGSIVRAHYCYQHATSAIAHAERSPADLRVQIPLGLAAAARLLRGAREDRLGGPAAQLLGHLKHVGTSPLPMQVRHMLWTLRLLARGPVAARTLGTLMMRNASIAPWRGVAHACRAAESLLRGRYRQCMSAAAEAEKWVRLTMDGSAATTPGVDMTALTRTMQDWAANMMDTTHMSATPDTDALPAHTEGLVWYCQAMRAQYCGDDVEARHAATQLAASAGHTELAGLALYARVILHATGSGQPPARQLADALEAVRLTSVLALSQVPLIAGLAGEICLRLNALAPLQSCVRRGLHAARRTHVRLGLTRLLRLAAALCERRGEHARALQWEARARRAARFLREATPPHQAD